MYAYLLTNTMAQRPEVGEVVKYADVYKSLFFIMEYMLFLMQGKALA